MTIGQRIKFRREELGITQDELAVRIGYKSRSSINKIELDIQGLTQSKIKRIADALQTTPSYIMGWDEEENLSRVQSETEIAELISKMSVQDKGKFLIEFGAKVKQCRLSKGYTLEELANAVGFTSDNARSSMQKIESGKSDLPVSRLCKLAAALDVSVTDLIGNCEPPVVHNKQSIFDTIESEFGDEVSAAFSMYVQLDMKDQAEIRGEMKQMLKGQKYSTQEGLKNA